MSSRHLPMFRTTPPAGLGKATSQRLLSLDSDGDYPVRALHHRARPVDRHRDPELCLSVDFRDHELLRL